MRYLFFGIYIVSVVRHMVTKRLQTMNTTNLCAQLNRNLWDEFIVYAGRF